MPRSPRGACMVGRTGGHVFWDEVFVLPYLALHVPETARAVLMYRHRRLPAAREAAMGADAQLCCSPPGGLCEQDGTI
ncbi:hypothetical protein [Streptomyces sp. NPDC085665]|uniref:hypothetical protein n=1 Tax=Streptomyces sp. NPDC085665 TaxID=3365735 RepID=UPI0037D26C5A